MASVVSIIPIVLLFILMLGFKMAGHKSALLTLVITVLLALFAASPLGMIAPEHAEDSVIALTGWAVVEGILKAVFPILIIILMAIYSYNILVESKQIDVIKRQFTSITDDKGLLVLLLVWGFGGLLEGMAGFGTAGAIPAAILIGLGFKPMFSALGSLIGNTVATGFGAVGVPVTTLCNEVAESGSASGAQICETSAFGKCKGFLILTLALSGKYLGVCDDGDNGCQRTDDGWCLRTEIIAADKLHYHGNHSHPEGDDEILDKIMLIGKRQDDERQDDKERRQLNNCESRSLANLCRRSRSAFRHLIAERSNRHTHGTKSRSHGITD